MRLLPVLIVCAVAAPAWGQQPAQPPSPQPPQFEERVDVVAVTPIHGVGLERLKVPANVQVFTAPQLTPATLDVSDLLARHASSVHLVEAQAGTFQPDLLFRGFAGSPLLGASEGIAVYQDGVRMNDPFGDTVHWDLLPTMAIASINLTPGSNPLFGLNALGGALSIQTKDGFAFPGHRVSVSTGSFGRHQLQVEAGGARRSLGYYIAGALTDEGGWRDFSPSTIRQLFGDLSWRGTATTFNVTVTAASNDLTGNGAAPVGLLEQRPSAVFTHPDRSDSDLSLVTLRAQRRRETAIVEGVAYYRHNRIGTLNGDAADHDAEDEVEFDGVNNLSRTRGQGGGATGQISRTAHIGGRDNHLVAGAGVDAAFSRFTFAVERAQLTPQRGTIGSGSLDEGAAVGLHSRTTTGGAFVTNTWSATDRLTVMGAARFNWTAVALRDQIGTALDGDHSFRRMNPAAGITYQARSDVNVYASYAQSSRVPTPVELTCADPEDPCRLPNAFVSDPPLNQIVAATWEAGVRGGRGRTDWNVTLFATDARDDIIFVSSGTIRGEGHFENVEFTRRRGLEASVEHVRNERFSAFASYTLQRATFETELRIASRFHPDADDAEIAVSAGDQLPTVPSHAVKGGVEAAVTSGLRAAVSVRTQSGQYLRGDEANLLPPLPGFVVVDAQVRQRIGDRIAVVVTGRNILGADYATFGILGDADLLGDDFEDEPRFRSPGAPRGAWVGLELRF